MRRLTLHFIPLIFSIINVNASVCITEIMPSNIATITSEKFDYNGFVELYNDGAPINLIGWEVANRTGEETEWSVKLDSSHIIPNGYSLLFFGKEETSSESAVKVNKQFAGSVGQKLTTDAGSLILQRGEERIEISYPKQYPHISYGKEGYMIPSPLSENNSAVLSVTDRASTPTFATAKPGLFGKQTIEISIECNTDSATIYYTTNGDIPTPENGTKYESEFPVDKTTVVRARAYKDGLLYSEVQTGSYIMSDKYYDVCADYGERLPIVSISANNADIFGDSLGIYVVGTNGVRSNCYEEPSNYNQDWTRSANIEYILDGEVVDNQEVEIGVYGGCTRTHVAKSLKIKANKRSGSNKMQYNDFFPRKEFKKYKSLALRNGGNGYSYVQPRWRDMYIQSLADGMDIDKQEAQPVGFYLNGTFYGMMILTERTNEDYLYHNYGLDENEIDLLSISGGEYVVDAGTRDAYDTMIDYVENHYSDSDFYDKLSEQIDVEEYINYQIIEQFVGNTDWVANNTKLWRKREGGKFRWILYDTDFGLSYKSSKVDTCMLDFATKIKGSKKAKTLLSHCMMNEDFRWRFLDKYLHCIENQFTDERIEAKWDSIYTITARDICATIKNAGFLKCPGNIATARQQAEEMTRFAKERKPIIVEQLRKEYGLAEEKVRVRIRPVFLTSDSTFPNFTYLINKKEYHEEKLDLEVFGGERIKAEMKIPRGFKLKNWAVNDETVRTASGERYTETSFSEIADKDLKITIYFERDEAYKLPRLHINEVCASNSSVMDEDDNTPDWIEIYNEEDYAVDLAGMIVANESKGVETVIREGADETVVAPHGYLLLWADKKSESGALHLDFKLSATNEETIQLRAQYMGETVLLSEMTYKTHATDCSYGRTSDGADETDVFVNCSDKEDNGKSVSTPKSANGSEVCEIEVSRYNDWTVDDGVSIYIYENALHIICNDDVEIYNVSGVFISREKIIRNVADGVYLVKAKKKTYKVIVKR